MESQTSEILKYLLKGHKLTALDAFNMFKTMRLAALIHALRKMNYPVNSNLVNTGKSGKLIAEYTLDLSCKDEILKKYQNDFKHSKPQ